MFSTGRKVLSLAVVAITASLAVPLIAQAQNGTRSAQAPDAFARAVVRHDIVVPDAFARAVARHNTTVTAPNDRGGQLGIGTQTAATAVVPDAFARAVARHNITGAGSTTTLSTNRSSLWTTLGVVALGIALALALVAAARLITRRQLAHS